MPESKLVIDNNTITWNTHYPTAAKSNGGEKQDLVTDNDVIINGNRMMGGNGFVGVRGTVEETDSAGMCSTIVNGFYDKKGNSWREPVNFPNGLYCAIFVENGVKPLTIENDDRLISHSQSINYKTGVFSRNSSWQVQTQNSPSDKKDSRCIPTVVNVKSERFVSMANKNLICDKYTVSCNDEINLKAIHGIDCKVYDINGPHLARFNVKPLKLNSFKNTTALISDCFTNEENVHLAVCHASLNPSNAFDLTSAENGNSGFLTNTITLQKNQEAVWYFFETISFEKDCDNPLLVCEKIISDAIGKGYEGLLLEHCDEWRKIWSAGDIIIDGDNDSQNALRYSLYQLQIIAPRRQNPHCPVSIPARGLSGQTYKGAVFWDTELFISPYFLYTNPEIARNLILYRIQTLEGAKRKASHYGFEGAFFAWESQETGDDACSDYNVVDVFTGRPQRTYFRDKQIHISGDIVYSICAYIEATGDKSILLDGAYELILECAKFYISACVFVPVKNRYEIHDVIGPDEYHERVNNNAYTNSMAKFTLGAAQNFSKILKKTDLEFYNKIHQKTNFTSYDKLLKDVLKKLYIPSPQKNEKMNGVIEQFDGYFELEDCTLSDVRKRLLNDKEYWGGANGIASNTRIIKQADTVLLLNMFPNEYSKEIKKANFEFYEKRTEHGSSLSACMYSLLSAEYGESNWGLNFFKESANIDISGKSKQFAGLIYIGGTHPAAAGGAWISAIRGFCGFSVKNGKPVVKPRLPDSWNKVSFSAVIYGKTYQITVGKKEVEIKKLCKK